MQSNRGRVLECSSSVGPSYAGKLFCELGFDVLATADPSRDPTLDLYLGAGKRTVEEGREKELAAAADIVFTDRPDAFAGIPGLLVSITPFGRTGPYAEFQGTEIVVDAMGGLLYLMGNPEREPVKHHGSQMSYFAGASAALAALATYYAGTYRGERIDISLMETVVALLEGAAQLVEYNGQVRRRFGSSVLGSGPCTDIYATSDGHISLAAQFPPQWKALCGAIERPDLAEDPRLATYALQAHHPELLEPILTEWFAARTTAEAFETLQMWRIPAGPVLTVADLVTDPQLEATEAWTALEGTSYRTLGRPFRAAGEEPEASFAPPRPATDAEIVAWGTPAGVRRASSRVRDPAGPLVGVRIVDLTAVYAGPFASRVLADLGAEVIKIEAGIRPDILRLIAPHASSTGETWNIGCFFHEYNRNKLGVALDLRSDEGRALLRGLVRESDALIENYSLRVMPNFGLSFDELANVNPRLVMASMPGFGTTGPYRDYVAFGEMIEPMAGLSSLTGYRDGPPLRGAIAFPDPVAGIHAAMSLVYGLMLRDEAGEAAGPAHYSMSHLHAMSRFIGEELLAQQEGRPPQRLGNRHPVFVPQGVFRCEGQDRWIAISVRNDAEWSALVDVVDDAELGDDGRFATAEGRRFHEDEIEVRVERRTRTWDDAQLARALQARGVPAGVVTDGPRVLADMHLRARRFFRKVEHPDVGETTISGPMWHFSRELEIRRPAPRLGEHTDEVLRRVLGLDDERLDALRESGVTSNAVPMGTSMSEA